MKKWISSLIVMTMLLTLLLPAMSFADAGPVTLNSIADKNPGDAVEISGSTSLTGSVNIKIIDPENKVMDLKTVDITTGVFAYAFKLKGDAIQGIYGVVAGQGTNVGTATFKVAAKAAPSPTPVTSPTPGPTSKPTSGPAAIPAASPASDTTTVVVETVLQSNGTAAAKAGLQAIANAFDKAIADKKGTKTISIELKGVEDARGYLLELPAEIFDTAKEDGSKKKIEIKTPAGTIILPDNMFNGQDMAGAKAVAISIAKADTSGLTPEIREKIGNRPVVEINASVDGKAVKWRNNGAPVEISMEYKPTAEEMKDPEHIAVWYIDGAGQVIAVPNGKYDPFTGRVTFKTSHFSQYAVVFVKKSFSDTGKHAWAVKQIEVLASKGVVEGTSDSSFSPGKEITRGEFIGWLVRALDLTADFNMNFEDVDSAYQYYQEIGIAKGLGVAQGTGGNQYRPDSLISRQDMMVLTVRALKAADKEPGAGTVNDIRGFTDVSKIAAYAVEDVASMVKEGLIVGSGNKLNPAATTTRAEAAVMLYRLYNK